MRTIVVVVDVTAGFDAVPARPLELAAAVAGTGADALICSVGRARAVRDAGSEQPLAVTVSETEPDGGSVLPVSPGALAGLGLWAIVVPMAVPAPREPPQLRALCEVVDFALRTGDGAPRVLADLRTASEAIVDRARGIRLACESGADVVMVSGVASIADVETVLERAFRPVYLSEAFPRANPLEYPHLLKRAASLGVAGVVAGPKLLRGRKPTDVATAVSAARHLARPRGYKLSTVARVGGPAGYKLSTVARVAGGTYCSYPNELARRWQWPPAPTLLS